ncbi:MAG: Ribonuclease PH, partial [uncultured Thermomicrobiales bacterium]
ERPSSGPGRQAAGRPVAEAAGPPPGWTRPRGAPPGVDHPRGGPVRRRLGADRGRRHPGALRGERRGEGAALDARQGPRLGDRRVRDAATGHQGADTTGGDAGTAGGAHGRDPAADRAVAAGGHRPRGAGRAADRRRLRRAPGRCRHALRGDHRRLCRAGAGVPEAARRAPTEARPPPRRRRGRQRRGRPRGAAARPRLLGGWRRGRRLQRRDDRRPGVRRAPGDRRAQPLHPGHPRRAPPAREHRPGWPLRRPARRARGPGAAGRPEERRLV